MPADLESARTADTRSSNEALLDEIREIVIAASVQNTDVLAEMTFCWRRVNLELAASADPRHSAPVADLDGGRQ